MTPLVGAWQPIQVPSAFESVLGQDYDGRVEYRRKLTFPRLKEKQDSRLLLRFKAVMTDAKVTLDGKLLGQHLGGWTPFSVKVPPELLRPGEVQELGVLVDEKVGHNTQGFLPTIAPHFGGIWQEVSLVHIEGPALDPDVTAVFTSYEDGKARLRVRLCEVAVASSSRLRFALFDGKKRLWSVAGKSGRKVHTLVPEIDLQPWSPESPRCYRFDVDLEDEHGKLLDRITRRVLFASLRVQGRSIYWNGEPLQIRGMLHWGYEPPTLDPAAPVEFWKTEFRYVKSLGFNLVKACLWLPPPAFFDAAEEVGLWVWQEYPAWHPDFSDKHLPALLREYEEFFRQDRNRKVILVRSLTCETGRATASAKVVEALYRRCKEMTGGSLVEDDSSWISWNRFFDFYDDHPYGNCGPWAQRLLGFDRYIVEHGPKPFLLGEAMTSDTWLDIDAVKAKLEGRRPWWTPWALGEHEAFERELGGAGSASLIGDSKSYALLARKYQFETFRRLLPRAGYVSSVLRDFTKARMGFYDDLGRPKWSAADFQWHGSQMLVLDDARPVRSLALRRGSALSELGLRLAGKLPRAGKAKLECSCELERWSDGSWTAAQKIDAAKKLVLQADGDLLSQPFHLPSFGALERSDAPGLMRARLQVSLGDSIRNEWRFYLCPSVKAGDSTKNLRIAETLTADLLGWVADGGRLLLVPGGRGCLRSQGIWFLRGAPYGPHSHPLLRAVPRDLLLHLQQLDFDGPVLLETPLTMAMDRILGFWDTHDRKDKVERYVLLAEARLGKGRILASALNLDLKPEKPFSVEDGVEPAPNPARAWLRQQLLQHLRTGPAPKAEIGSGLLARVRSKITERRRPLDGEWKLKADAKDMGLKEKWFSLAHDDGDWLKARAGIHWEHVGLPHHNGVAWYRKRFEPPEGWQPGHALYAVFEGVDDSYFLYVNGHKVASFGNPESGETVWLIRTHAEISKYIQKGKNLLALRVVDHTGAGGLHRPVFLSTGDPETPDILND